MFDSDITFRGSRRSELGGGRKRASESRQVSQLVDHDSSYVLSKLERFCLASAVFRVDGTDMVFVIVTVLTGDFGPVWVPMSLLFFECIF